MSQLHSTRDLQTVSLFMIYSICATYLTLSGRGPFLVFFDGVGQQQRGLADERAQRVADHVVRLRHAEGEAVLRILDPRAEGAAKQRREGDSPPAVPSSRQGVGQRQPHREE